MGALNTKQWAEVLTTGSPGSPEAAGSRTGTTDSVSSADNSLSTSTGQIDDVVDEKIEGSGDLPRPKHRNLKNLDPRSVTDDVDRTPIQLEKSAKSRVNKSESDDDDDVGDVTKDDDDDEETNTSGQELLSQEFLSTPTAIDKQLNKFKVPKYYF